MARIRHIFGAVGMPFDSLTSSREDKKGFLDNLTNLHARDCGNLFSSCSRLYKSRDNYTTLTLLRFMCSSWRISRRKHAAAQMISIKHLDQLNLVDLFKQLGEFCCCRDGIVDVDNARIDCNPTQANMSQTQLYNNITVEFNRLSITKHKDTAQLADFVVIANAIKQELRRSFGHERLSLLVQIRSLANDPTRDSYRDMYQRHGMFNMHDASVILCCAYLSQTIAFPLLTTMNSECYSEMKTQLDLMHELVDYSKQSSSHICFDTDEEMPEGYIVKFKHFQQALECFERECAIFN